jgi:hypothetical protein
MIESDTASAGVEDRHAYIRIDDGKPNYAAREETRWLHIDEELLKNFDGTHGPDSVGVVSAWRFPGAFDGVGSVHLDEVIERAASGRYRADPQSPDWIGVAIADVLHLDPIQDAKRIKAILKGWMETRELKKVQRKDGARRLRTFVVPRNFEDCSTS